VKAAIDPLTVACPEPYVGCGAPVGSPCVDDRGVTRATHPERWALVRPASTEVEVVRRPLIYLAHAVAPSPSQLAEMEIAQLSDKTRGETIARIIDSNLRRARRWLRWFAIHVPQWVVIAPWIAAVQSVMEAGGTESEERAREMVVCREVASRCAAVVQVGGRVSSGMADEGAACGRVVDLTAFGEEPPADAEVIAMLLCECEAVMRG
jgi:hypothetical protein